MTRMRLGPGKHLHGKTLMEGVVKGEDFDYFQYAWKQLSLNAWADALRSELVLNQELARIAARGYGDGLNGGVVIGLPPILNFAKEPLRSKVLEEVFSGQKVKDLRSQFEMD